MLSCFLLGAIGSIIITSLIYAVTDKLIPITDNFSVAKQFVKAFLVVALTEELSKYVIVLYFAQPKKNFNEPFDGIVYALML